MAFQVTLAIPSATNRTLPSPTPPLRLDGIKKPLMATDGTLAQLKEAKVAFAAILDFGTISLGAKSYMR